MRIPVSASEIALFLLAVSLFSLPQPSLAQELTLRFEISPVITGARPWDGTGLNSAQLDSDGSDKIGLGTSILGQMGLDQVNQRMAPPDPYICLVLTDEPKLTCYPDRTERDTLKYEITIPAAMVDRQWFGVVLLDSDRGNVIGGEDDLIGYGVVLDEPTLAEVRDGNPKARAVAAQAEKTVTEAVRRTVGINRSLFGPLGGGRLDAAKLAVSKCDYGCAMGESMLYITTAVDGW